MLFTLKFSGNIHNFMRQAGYHPHQMGEEKLGESSFVRRVGASDYPRFHVYLKILAENTQEIAFNIHIDQKKPSYRGAAAHGGEYGGELVEREAERIKKMNREVHL